MTNTSQLLAQRLKALRERAGLSQEELARRTRLSRPAISQIENGERKVAADELPALGDALGVTLNVLMGVESEPEVVLARDAAPARPEPGLRINVPRKNLAKFKEVLLYVLGRVGSRPNIGETVIYKLLYFIDFDYYEKYEEQLIGATYIRNKFGPTPVEFKKVIAAMEKAGEIEPVTSKVYDFVQRKYLPLREPDLSVLSGRELVLIDDVLGRLSDMTAVQISEYSHGDVPWRGTAEGKPIEYEAVFYRLPPYSQRVYDKPV